MGRRCRHLNPAHLGAVLALDARFLPVGDGVAVDTWADRGGSGRQVTQTGTARPVRQGSWVQFDGANDTMTGSDTGMPTGDFYLCATVRCELAMTKTEYEPVVCWGTSSVAGRAVVLMFADDNTPGNDDALSISQWGDSVGIANSTTSRLIAEARRSGTSYAVSRNRGAESTKTMTTNTVLGGSAGLTLGSFGTLLPGYFLDGEIGAVTVFNNVPSLSVRNRVAYSCALSFKIPAS